MKKKQCILLLCLFIFLLFIPSCKTTEFELVVLVGEGIQGYPAQGFYVYKWKDYVQYSYNTIEGYTNLKVMLNDEPVAVFGQIQMNDNYIITVTAEREQIENQ